MRQKIDEVAAVIRQRLGFDPEVAIVLGSGLGGLADRIEQPVYLPYGEIPGFKASTAPGHAGRFVAGMLAGKRVICMQGRLHFYEGHTMQEIAFPVRVLKALGVRALVLTNAAGGVNLDFSVGDLMLIEDHINFMGANPLTGPNDESVGPRFCDMSTAYDPALRALLAQVAAEQGVPLRTGVFGAEPWTEEMRHDIEQKMGINALNIYGLSEIMGPGVAMECVEAKTGMHLWEDLFLPEIIDPVTGEQLPPGEVGELVLTTLTKEGIPLVRYRTRDLTSLDYTPCCCGRTHVRITRLRGRTDDMLIIRGVNVFPQQIEGLLMEQRVLSPNYQLVVDRVNNLDTLEVRVEMGEHLFADEIGKLQTLERTLQKNIKEYLGVTVKVRLMEPHSIERSEGKARRIVDNRPKD